MNHDLRWLCLSDTTPHADHCKIVHHKLYASSDTYMMQQVCCPDSVSTTYPGCCSVLRKDVDMFCVGYDIKIFPLPFPRTLL